MEAFNADVELLPQWVQIWMNFLGFVLIGSVLAFLIRKDTRVMGLIMFVTTAAGIAVMVWMHAQMGMVRLLGIVHVVIWTPLVIYMWKRLRSDPPGKLYSAIFFLTIATLGVSLAFDYVDVIRWLLGERAPMVG